jgi:Ca2+-binding RTX toxin-like protein
MRRFLLPLVALSLLVPAAAVLAKTSHAGWPEIDGKLKMHSRDQNGVIRGVPNRHNELLGGHGHDTIYAGDAGDVIWGDYKESTQPTSQFDRLFGGNGRDFIYASHGRNYISTGGGRDVVHAHFGRGTIRCGSGGTIVYISHRSRPRYHLVGCRRVSYKPARK